MPPPPSWRREARLLLDPGTYDVVVTLLTPRGSVLALRRTSVTVDGATGLLVILNRGCDGLDGCEWRGGTCTAPPR